MKRQSLRIAVAIGVLLGVAAAQTPDWARAQWEHSPRQKAWLQIPNGNRTVDTFVVFPENKTKQAPVVVVIHDVPGMNDYVQNLADQFAAKGFIAMAPDLLSGMGPSGGGSNSFADHRWAQQANEKLPAAQVMADLNAVADVAKTFPGSNGKLAVMGFGWGGMQAFHFAGQRADLNAAFVFETAAPTDAAELGKIQAAVYQFYSGNDKKISDSIIQTRQMMQGKTFEPVSYEGANSNFLFMAEAPFPTTFDVEAHDKAWKQMAQVLNGL